MAMDLGRVNKIMQRLEPKVRNMAMRSDTLEQIEPRMTEAEREASTAVLVSEIVEVVDALAPVVAENVEFQRTREPIPPPKRPEPEDGTAIQIGGVDHTYNATERTWEPVPEEPV